MDSVTIGSPVLLGSSKSHQNYQPSISLQYINNQLFKFLNLLYNYYQINIRSMRSSKLFPQLNLRNSTDPLNFNKNLTDDDFNFNGRTPKSLFTNQQKSNNKNNLTGYENFFKKGSTLQPSSQQKKMDNNIIKQIDSKLDSHKKEIDQRNDMIISIERGFETMKGELTKEKQKSEEKQKQINELLTVNNQLQSKLKVIVIKMEEYQSKVSSLEKECSELKKEDSGKGKEQELEQQLHDLQKQLDNQLKLNKRNSSSQEMVNAQMAALKNDLQNLADVKTKNEGEIANLNNKLKEVQHRFQEEELAKDKIKKQLESQKVDFENKSAQMQKEIANLKEELKANQVLKGIVQDTQELQTQISSMKSRQQELERDLTNSKNQLQDSMNQRKSQEAEISSLKKLQQSYEQKESLLKSEIEKQKQVIDQQKKEMEESCQSVSKLEREKTDSEKKYSELQSAIINLNKQIENLKQIIVEKDKKKNNSGSKGILENISSLEKAEKEMIKNLECTYCKKFIQKPVTIIPCGHSYCYDCKKGYNKECFKCGPKVKVEAMYRNELLDDIIEMVKIIQNSIACMKQNSQ